MSTLEISPLPWSYQTYLFDLDGTLLNTTPDIATAVNLTRHVYGLQPLSEEEVELGVGRGAMELIRATFPQELHGELHSIREEFVNAYREHLCVGTHPFPNAIPLLKALRSHEKKIGLVTNKPRDLAIPLLKKLEMFELFEVYYYGDSLPTKKPSPEPLIEAARALNSRTERCLFIGDTEVDAQAAYAAQMPLALVHWGRHAPIAHAKGGEALIIDFSHQARE